MPVNRARLKILALSRTLSETTGGGLRSRRLAFDKLLRELDFILSSVDYYRSNLNRHFNELRDEIREYLEKHPQREAVLGSHVKSKIYFDLHACISLIIEGLDRLAKMNAPFFTIEEAGFHSHNFDRLFCGDKDHTPVFMKHPDLARLKEEWDEWAKDLKDYRESLTHRFGLYDGHSVHLIHGKAQDEILLPDNPGEKDPKFFSYENRIKMQDYAKLVFDRFIALCEWNSGYLGEKIRDLDYFKS
jgi:hypothetical protein